MRIWVNLFLLALLSCTKPESVDQPCVKGRYLTAYCEGVVIQILDGTPIGKEWKRTDSQICQSRVVASLDTLIFKNLPSTVLTQDDSTFYFQYRVGGYPQRAYILCNPPPFITITSLAKASCR
ncbi:hypothetical protein GO755_31460 [Spirosoma sp. HMF4905]|uniref:Lipoprotein n=1 Tax=Spirosoma arboris TaxID=2682092 RepID=A0A7K1SLA2_9BACT|nr:hypothetical protein [Spirosoma arboris]MVM34589.1 hypothetical protein [Spirosoma arboris]